MLTFGFFLVGIGLWKWLGQNCDTSFLWFAGANFVFGINDIQMGNMKGAALSFLIAGVMAFFYTKSKK